MGQNAFHYLFESFDSDLLNAKEIAWKLLGMKLDANKLNKDSYSPIHMACKYKQIEAIWFAINTNISEGKEVFDFMIEAKHKWSLFHVAAFYSFEDLFELYFSGSSSEVKYLLKRVNVIAWDAGFKKASEMIPFNLYFYKWI